MEVVPWINISLQVLPVWMKSVLQNGILNNVRMNEETYRAVQARFQVQHQN